MRDVRTVTVWEIDGGRKVLINAIDFDEERHSREDPEVVEDEDEDEALVLRNQDGDEIAGDAEVPTASVDPAGTEVEIEADVDDVEADVEDKPKRRPRRAKKE